MRRLAACLLGLALPLASQASPALASEMGCYNCHGAPVRADAPGFERLSAKYAQRRDKAGAEQHAVDELLQGEGFRHIPAHEHLSPETARKLVHWLFEGGK
jgi:cytochrome c551/c552